MSENLNSGKRKLDRLAESLLDVGKRNNLVNFRDLKVATGELVFPDPEAIFDRCQDNGSFDVVTPLSERTITRGIRDSAKERENSKDEFVQENVSSVRKKNEALLYNAKSSSEKVLRSLRKKAKEFAEERGIEVLYLAFGFLHWNEPFDPETFYEAPILLLPVHIETNDNPSGTGFSIVPNGDGAIVNPTLVVKLNLELNFKLPEYQEGQELREYLSEIDGLLSKYGWKVTDECKIAIFSFLKINLYKDLKDNADLILKNPNALRLLNEEIPEELKEEPITVMNLKDPLSELHNVVDADSSQLRAIQMAVSGQSFVLQGPPGTGKSQTITNIIAELVEAGKKVLFVSEKRAALDVVFNKLKSEGLSDFCIQLHSDKTSKKEFDDELDRTLKLSRISYSEYSHAMIHQSESSLERKLDAHAAVLHRPEPSLGMSIYDLLELYSEEGETPSFDALIPDLENKGVAYLDEALPLLRNYSSFAGSIGHDYKKHPWYGFVGDASSFQKRHEILSEIEDAGKCYKYLLSASEKIRDRYDVSLPSRSELEKWFGLCQILEGYEDLSPALFGAKTNEEATQKVDALGLEAKEMAKLERDLRKDFKPAVMDLDGDAICKQILKGFSGPFYRFFDKDYLRIKRSFRTVCLKKKSLSLNEMWNVSKKIARAQEIRKDFLGLGPSQKALFGKAYQGAETDWQALAEKLSEIQRFLQSGIDLGSFPQKKSLAEELPVLSAAEEAFKNAQRMLPGERAKHLEECFDPEVVDFENGNLSSIQERLDLLLSKKDEMVEYSHFEPLLRRLSELGLLGFVDEALLRNADPSLLPDAFRKAFHFQWIDRLLCQDKDLASFHRISQDDAVADFQTVDRRMIVNNRRMIASDLSKRRPLLALVKPRSDLAFLLHECEKKRMKKGVRVVLQRAGRLVQEIKPCFLMSPLSVSTYLDPSTISFDVVIFDEASQIFPQDAVGAIYRGKQLIVVGDSKQMPPTNFFQTSLEGDEEEEDAVDDDIQGFESILDLCSSYLPQQSLRWHYRSRSENLIAFSNAAFYSNSLVTFPEPVRGKKDRGVRFEYMEGTYESRRNRKEAARVVELIYEHIERYPERSLGVVAFSISQQEAIEDLLDEARAKYRNKEFFFSDDKPEPFFIKNLETVQGDERDTIILSVSYGPDAKGNVSHNFGPLNRAQGERRLNVAITRAKQSMIVVSSMKSTDIDLSRTSSEGARLLKLYLQYAEEGPSVLPAEEIVSGVFETEKKHALEEEVASFIRKAGYQADTLVGCSEYRIDVAVKLPGTEDYVLAIECDGYTYARFENARDRDRLRQEILEGMGWSYYRLWSVEWFKNRGIEERKLLMAIEKAVQKAQAQKRIDESKEAAMRKKFAEPSALSSGESRPRAHASEQKASKSFAFSSEQDLKGGASFTPSAVGKRDLSEASSLPSKTGRMPEINDSSVSVGEAEGSSSSSGPIKEVNKSMWMDDGSFYKDALAKLAREETNKQRERERSQESKEAQISERAADKPMGQANPAFSATSEQKVAEGTDRETPEGRPDVSEPLPFEETPINGENLVEPVEKADERYGFQIYQKADVERLWFDYMERNRLSRKSVADPFQDWKDRFMDLVRAVLAVEAPLSRDYLMERVSPYLGGKSQTEKTFEWLMQGIAQYGIKEEDGFLFLKDRKIEFRIPKKSERYPRPLQYIAIPELSNGMERILRTLGPMSRESLFRVLGREAGFTKLESRDYSRLEATLVFLQDRLGDELKVDDRRISIV